MARVRTSTTAARRSHSGRDKSRKRNHFARSRKRLDNPVFKEIDVAHRARENAHTVLAVSLWRKQRLPSYELLVTRPSMVLWSWRVCLQTMRVVEPVV